LLTDISRFLAYETTRFLPTQTVDIVTPLEKTKSDVIAQDLVIVSILRAGAGMLDGFLQTLPQARVGHIGIYRDKFLNNTIEYYLRMPEKIQGQPVFVLDPLLATGSTALAALSRIKEFEVGEIHFVCLLAAPQGLALLTQHHSDVTVHTLSIERDLDNHGFILPGIGDAGGRLYGT
jgi:uracil phosphoribosyltransferase